LERVCGSPFQAHCSYCQVSLAANFTELQEHAESFEHMCNMQQVAAGEQQQQTSAGFRYVAYYTYYIITLPRHCWLSDGCWRQSCSVAAFLIINLCFCTVGLHCDVVWTATLTNFVRCPCSRFWFYATLIFSFRIIIIIIIHLPCLADSVHALVRCLSVCLFAPSCICSVTSGFSTATENSTVQDILLWGRLRLSRVTVNTWQLCVC